MFAWHELLDFWFGPLDEHGLPDKAHRERWFRSSRAFDQEIRRRFISMVLFASENGLDHWRQEPGGRLAEIILLDQFTRHIHRGGELAFSNDRQAVACASRALRPAPIRGWCQFTGRSSICRSSTRKNWRTRIVR